MLGTRLFNVFWNLVAMGFLIWSYRRELRRVAGRVSFECPYCRYGLEGQRRAVCSECGRVISGRALLEIGMARARPRFVGFCVLNISFLWVLTWFTTRTLLEIHRVLLLGNAAFVPGYPLFRPVDSLQVLVPILGGGMAVALAIDCTKRTLSAFSSRENILKETAARLETQLNGAAHSSVVVVAESETSE